jgi:signal transduction histidine kinase
MLRPESRKTRIAILACVIAFTLGVHYGWIIDPIFGHVHWAHAIHGRFCYIPIVMAAVWFGIAGGLMAATAISLLLLPYLLGSGLDAAALADEITEIVFYFAIATLTGWLIGREMKSRRRAQEARVQLERSQKLSLVGQIAAGLAHEVKNPLASIKGAVEILGDRSTSPEEKQEFGEIVVKEIKRIDESVTGFLEFARPSDWNPAEINLSDVLAGSVKQIAAQARKKSVTIDADLQSGVVLNADEEKIHQVLLNLLLNAIDAAGESGAVRVTLVRSESGRTAGIVVQDTGPGIAEADRERVFEPFFTSKASGTGLGLAIAKSIVERHGGAISIENAPEGGARAIVTLPVPGGKA